MPISAIAPDDLPELHSVLSESDYCDSKHTAQPAVQLARADDVPGGPIFVRIASADDGFGSQVPSLSISRDRTNWSSGENGRILLDGGKANSGNQDWCFLNLPLENGVGKLLCSGSGQFEFMYAAIPRAALVQDHIHEAQVPVGKCRITFNPSLKNLEGMLMVCPGVPLALIIEGQRLQFATSVGYRFSSRVANVTAAFYHKVPYGATLAMRARCIGLGGHGACFVLDDGRKWPFYFLEAITALDAHVEEVTEEEFASYPTGPALPST